MLFERCFQGSFGSHQAADPGASFRPGHDRRYAIDCSKIKTELGWERKMTFEEGLSATVHWNLSHPDWIARIRSGEYLKWLEHNYSGR